MEEEAICRQPEPIYATLLGIFQQAMEHTCWEELVKRKSTATWAKSPCEKIDAYECKVCVWMWLIKVYRWRRSAIYSLNLDPVADTARLHLVNKKNKLPKQTKQNLKDNLPTQFCWLLSSAPPAVMPILAQRPNVLLILRSRADPFLYQPLAQQIDTCQKLCQHNAYA